MPKILDLIYRVKDEASANLAKLRQGTAGVGVAMEGVSTKGKTLGGFISSLKKSFSELLIPIGLGITAWKAFIGIMNQAVDEYSRVIRAQYEAAKSAGTLTDELIEQNAALLVYNQSHEQANKLTETFIDQTNRRRIAIENGMSAWAANTQAVTDLYNAEKLAAQETQHASTETKNLTVNQYLLAAAEEDLVGNHDMAQYWRDQAAALQGYNTQLSSAVAWMRYLAGLGPMPSAGGGHGTGTPWVSDGGGGGNVVFNGQTFQNAEWRGDQLWVRGQLFGTFPGHATGGEFDVGGKGGIDNNLVSFRASRGEHVSVTPAGGDPNERLYREMRATRQAIDRLGSILPTVLRDAVERAK